MERLTLGKRIRKTRKDAGITMKEFAAVLGISVDVLKALEKDRFQPRIHVLVTIKNKFGVNYEWLLEGDQSFLAVVKK